MHGEALGGGGRARADHSQHSALPRRLWHLGHSTVYSHFELRVFYQRKIGGVTGNCRTFVRGEQGWEGATAPAPPLARFPVTIEIHLPLRERTV